MALAILRPHLPVDDANGSSEVSVDIDALSWERSTVEIYLTCREILLEKAVTRCHQLHRPDIALGICYRTWAAGRTTDWRNVIDVQNDGHGGAGGPLLTALRIPVNAAGQRLYIGRDGQIYDTACPGLKRWKAGALGIRIALLCTRSAAARA